MIHYRFTIGDLFIYMRIYQISYRKTKQQKDQVNDRNELQIQHR